MNNAQLIAIAVPFVILLGAIVAGAWLNQRGLERQMDAFRSEIKAEIGAFKSEIKSEMKTGDSEIKAEMGAFKSENKAQIAILRAEIREEIAPIRSDLHQVKQSVEKIERQLEAIFTRLVFPK